MIKTINNPFAAFAARYSKTEHPVNRCPQVEGSGTG